METKRYRADVLKCFKNDDGETIYTEYGFNRQLIIVNEIGEIVHKSEVHHPDSDIITHFKGKEFLVFSGSTDVYIKTIDNHFDIKTGLNYKELSAKFDKLLKDITKEDFEDFLLKYKDENNK